MARLAARRGSHALALWLCNGHDPVVMSQIGMHASALMRLPAEPCRPQAAAALVRSLMAIGREKDSVELAHKFIAMWPRLRVELASIVLSSLASDSPLLTSPAHKASVLAAEERFDEALSVLDQLPSERRDADVSLLRAACAAGSGDAALLERHICDALAAQGLRRIYLRSGVQGIRAFSAEPAFLHGKLALVSVIVPVRNVGTWVGIALDSLRQQDYGALEIIVVDDASTDETQDVVLGCAREDSRIKYVRMSHRGGPYAARNAGLRMARGEFATFHDGDDWSHPQKVALQVEHLQRAPRVVACVSDWVRIGPNGTPVARQGYPLARMNTSSLLYRREPVLSRIGLFDCVLTGADSEFLGRLRLAFGANAVGRIRRILSFASWRPESLTQAPETGFASAEGRQQRLSYWESWNRWHAALLADNRLPDMRLTGFERPFAVPPSLIATQSAVRQECKVNGWSKH